MTIQILGAGCAKCEKLLAHTREAVQLAGVEAQIEKVTDARAIAQAGVLFTPALAIDGKVQFAGKVLKPTEIAKLLTQAAGQ